MPAFDIPPRAVRAFSLAAALVCLLVASACSDATPRPTPTPWVVVATPGPTATPWIVVATPGPTATPWIVTPTPQPTARPTSTPTPQAQSIPATPAGPGICGRTPEVQQAIIDRLQIPSCQLITTAELYRIRDLGEIRVPELRAGDFYGLVNLYELKIRLWGADQQQPPTIPDGAFEGSRIRSLEIGSRSSSNTCVDIEDGAFDGAHIEVLHVCLAAGLAGTLNLPASLHGLVLTGDLTKLDWQIFRAVPELQEVSLKHYDPRRTPYPTPEPPARQIRIPNGAFDGNLKIAGLTLDVDSSYGSPDGFLANTSLLSSHPELVRVEIANFTVLGREAGRFPLELHPDSPLAEELTRDGLREWESWQNGQDVVK